MFEAGHSDQFRVMILTRVVSKYQASLKRHLSGERQLYRTRQERELCWAEQGGKATKSTWFRRAGLTTMLTIPTTPGSVLAKNVKGKLDSCNPPFRTKVGVIEGGGKTIAQVLSGKRNPFPGASCGRPDCTLARREDGCKGQCYKEGVGYSGHCVRCGEEQEQGGVAEDQAVDYVYHGETSRSLFTRASQHFSDYSSHIAGKKVKEKSSWMWDHTEVAHQRVIS